MPVYLPTSPPRHISTTMGKELTLIVAQPMFSGLLMDELGMTSLFPYATVFVALAFVTMLFVVHGDNKPVAKKGLEALDVED